MNYSKNYLQKHYKKQEDMAHESTFEYVSEAFKLVAIGAIVIIFGFIFIGLFMVFKK